MITQADQREWLQRLFEQAGPGMEAADPDWLRQLRNGARQAAGNMPVPDRKQEAWRYTSIDALLEKQFRTPRQDPALTRLERIREILPPALGAWRLVFVNGRYLPALSDVGVLPAGSVSGSLREALSRDADVLARWFGHAAHHTGHVFTALNTALLHDGVYVHLEQGVELPQPIEVVYLNLSDEAAIMAPSRNLIVLEAGASATLIERFVGRRPSSDFTNNLADIVVGERAGLRHYRILEDSPGASHLSSLYVSQAGRSRYDSVTAALGGAWSRTECRVVFEDAGAECDINGLYVVGDRQLTDFHLDVHHKVPACTSRERFKGILFGKGRAVFNGHVVVDRNAQRSDAHLSNDNLMLSRDAEIDTKPQLEIYADDVKCGHGTTVGQLDPQQVFYLRSRGIAEAAARRMLCLGFAAQIVDAIDVAALREHVSESLQRLLGGTALSGG